MKTQMIFQKTVCYIMLIVAAICFISALGLCTTIYDVLYTFSNENGRPRVEGANLYFEIQPFNNAFVMYGIIMILLAVQLFITMTHKRRKYYIANIISTLGAAICNIVLCCITVVNLFGYRASFLAVDFETLKHMIDEIYRNLTFSDSTFCFDFAIFSCVLMALASIALVANLVWKFVVIKKENEQLGKASIKGTEAVK